MYKFGIFVFAMYANSIFANESTEASFLVQSKAIFSESINVPEKVLAECNSLENILSQTVKTQLTKSFSQVDFLDEGKINENKYIVQLEIASLSAAGGGGWSGAKAISVNTQVILNDQVIAKKIIDSRGKGIPMQGTCSIVEDVVEDAGEKVAAWINLAYKSNFQQKVSSLVSGSEKPLALLSFVSFEDESKIPVKILQECDLGQQISQFTYSFLQKNINGIERVNSVEEASNYRLLKIQITQANGEAGGSFSGSKGISVRASIVDNAIEVSHTQFSKSGGKAGIFGPIKGTCSILEGVSKHLGKDIAVWAYTQEMQLQLALINEEADPLLIAPPDMLNRLVQNFYKSKSASEQDLESAATRLFRDFNNSDATDSMAWICRLLGQSENSRYKDVLKYVEEKADSSKLRKYAKKALKEFSDENSEQFHPTGFTAN